MYVAIGESAWGDHEIYLKFRYIFKWNLYLT